MSDKKYFDAKGLKPEDVANLPPISPGEAAETKKEIEALTVGVMLDDEQAKEVARELLGALVQVAGQAELVGFLRAILQAADSEIARFAAPLN